MDSLMKAIGSALAALLETVGITGRARRRASVAADLHLLRELEAFASFSIGTFAHSVLSAHIERDIAALAGVDLRSSRRDIPWSSVVFAGLAMLGFGYWTYAINRGGFRWYSIPTGLLATLMLLSILGMLTKKVEVAPDTPTPQDAPAGEVSQA